MGLLDIGLIALVVLAAMTGWRAGGLRTAFGILGAIAGLLVGLVFAGWVSRSGLSFGVRVVGELAAIVVGMAITAALLHRLTRHTWQRRTRPAVPDRLLGAVLRGLGAVVVLSLVLQGLLLWSSSPGTRPAGSSAIAELADTPSWLPDVHLAALTETVRAALPADIDGLVPATARATDTPVYISDAVANATLAVTATEPGSATLSEGSGFVVSGQRVVTAYHVVDDGGRVTVRSAGRSYAASILLADERNDLAVLSVPGLPVAPLTVADQAADPGMHATVVGFPYGGRQRARSATVVGGVAIPVGSWSSGGPALRSGYRLATEVRPGNSGGPLLGDGGRVIGVIDSRSLVNPEVGFAITAEPLRADLLRGGSSANLAQG